MKDWKGVRARKCREGRVDGTALRCADEDGRRRGEGEAENSLLCGVESSIFGKLLVPAASLISFLSDDLFETSNCLSPEDHMGGPTYTCALSLYFLL